MKKAFTLIELLIVITIIGIISGVVVVQMIGSANTAKDAKRKSDVELIKNALIQYRAENYSKGSIQPATCSIGEDCTELDSDIQSFLETLPKDPDGGFYTYRSATGSDCYISAVLSNGNSYTYDCGAATIIPGTPVNGECGDITSATTLTSTTPGLCNQGVPVLFSGTTGPWTWTCSGTDGGDKNDTCFAFVQMNCSVLSDCGGATEVLKMYSADGGHAELPGQPYYSQKVCCSGPELGTSCSATNNSIILKLSSVTNAHVGSDYTNDACLSTSNDYDVACSYASDCSTIGPEYECLASISDTTNAHIGDCDTFATKVCCNVY